MGLDFAPRCIRGMTAVGLRSNIISVLDIVLSTCVARKFRVRHSMGRSLITAGAQARLTGLVYMCEAGGANSEARWD